MATLFANIFSRQVCSLRTLNYQKGVFQTHISVFRNGFVKTHSFFNRHGGSYKNKDPFFYRFAAYSIAGVGLGMATNTKSQNDSTAQTTVSPSGTPVQSPPPPSPPPPSSAVNMYELTFGSLCGICAGVFIKKGAKAVACILGGAFVLLQYLVSVSGVIRVDWERMGTRFENIFYTTDANGVRHPPSFISLWNWLVNFLTADFQPRASFIAGLALGLRIG